MRNICIKREELYEGSASSDVEACEPGYGCGEPVLPPTVSRLGRSVVVAARDLCPAHRPPLPRALGVVL